MSGKTGTPNVSLFLEFFII